MKQYLVLKSFHGSIGGCHLRRFVEGTTVEINDPDLAAVALAEKWVTPVDDLAGAPMGVDDFPEDYAMYTVLQEIQLPGEEGDEPTEILAVGTEIGMSAAEAQDFIDAGLIAPVEVANAEAEPEKAVESAPKNKARKAAPKGKTPPAPPQAGGESTE